MDIVRLEYWNENTGQFPVNPWKMSREFFQYVRRIFPVCPWNFSMESMEFFHGIHGLFPQSMEIVQGISGQNPWTMSMEKFHGQSPWKSSMDNVHRKVPWTMSMEFVQVHCGQNPWTNPWTMSMEYFQEHCPLIYSRWLCSVNPEKTFESYCFHAHYGKMHLWLTLERLRK